MERNDANARRERLKNRTKRSARNREKTGLGSKTVLDYSKANPLSMKEDRPILFKFDTEKGKKRLIDNLPFVITQDWYKDMREKSGEKIGLIPGDVDYKLEYPTHKTKNGPMICLNLAFGKECPFCNELYAEWNKDKKDQDQDKINAMKTSWRCSYNVYDYDGSGEIELWDNQSYANFEKFLQEEVDCDPDGLATFADLEQGKSIEYTTREESFSGNPYHEAKTISFVDREPYDESILDKVHPLDAMLIIPTEDEVNKAFLEVIGQNNRQSEPEPEQQTNSRQRPRPGVKKESEFNECLSGYAWGKDHNNQPDCEKCDDTTFENCGLEFNRLNTMDSDNTVTNEVKEEPEQTTRRRRRM